MSVSSTMMSTSPLSRKNISRPMVPLRISHSPCGKAWNESTVTIESTNSSPLEAKTGTFLTASRQMCDMTSVESAPLRSLATSWISTPFVRAHVYSKKLKARARSSVGSFWYAM